MDAITNPPYSATDSPRFVLPNVRRLFVPDKGMMICDADLSGADAQVVAWEADDLDLKIAFRAGVKIHEKNARDIWGNEYDQLSGDRSIKSTPKGKRYDECKRAVHATNYGAAPRTLTLNPEIRWPIHTSEAFNRRWFNLHPGVRTWHDRIQLCLQTDRTIRNRFGYRIIYFDRIDSLFSQALAWGPQSTVAEVCFRAALQLRDAFPWLEILLQVHDSLVFQFPIRYHEPEWINRIRERLTVPIPYPDPLTIPWGMHFSTKSWGDCK